jgi:hypothetical protein
MTVEQAERYFKHKDQHTVNTEKFNYD